MMKLAKFVVLCALAFTTLFVAWSEIWAFWYWELETWGDISLWLSQWKLHVEWVMLTYAWFYVTPACTVVWAWVHVHCWATGIDHPQWKSVLFVINAVLWAPVSVGLLLLAGLNILAGAAWAGAAVVAKEE